MGGEKLLLLQGYKIGCLTNIDGSGVKPAYTGSAHYVMV